MLSCSFGQEDVPKITTFFILYFEVKILITIPSMSSKEFTSRVKEVKLEDKEPYEKIKKKSKDHRG